MKGEVKLCNRKNLIEWSRISGEFSYGAREEEGTYLLPTSLVRHLGRVDQVLYSL
jgi:hypothetical protein